jgi:hypothetical protein
MQLDIHTSLSSDSSAYLNGIAFLQSHIECPFLIGSRGLNVGLLVNFVQNFLVAHVMKNLVTNVYSRINISPGITLNNLF